MEVVTNGRVNTGGESEMSVSDPESCADGGEELDAMVSRVEWTLAASCEAIVTLKSLLDGCHSEMTTIKDCVSNLKHKFRSTALDVPVNTPVEGNLNATFLLDRAEELDKRQAALSQREDKVVEREKAAVRKVEDLKDAAMAAIAAEKEKLQSLRNSVSTARVPAVERKVAAKDTDETAAGDPNSLGRGALGIVNHLAAGVNVVAMPEATEAGERIEAGARIPRREGISSNVELTGVTKAAKKQDSRLDAFPVVELHMAVEGGHAAAPISETLDVPDALREAVREGNGEAVFRFLVGKHVNAVVLQKGIMLSSDPAALVLKVVKEVLPVLHREKIVGGGRGMGVGGGRGGGGRGNIGGERGTAEKERASAKIIRVVDTVLEALDSVVEKHGVESIPISDAIQGEASQLAHRWLDSLGKPVSEKSAVEAHVLLQLIAAFRIRNHFAADELFEYFKIAAKRCQGARLCQAIGLEDRVPDLIEVLIKTKKPLLALTLSHAFGCAPGVPPRVLLEEHLAEASRKVREGKHSSGMEDHEMTQAVSALKAVLHMIRVLGIEAEYPPRPLLAKVAELERGKAELSERRKRTAQEEISNRILKRRRPSPSHPPFPLTTPKPASNRYPPAAATRSLAGRKREGSKPGSEKPRDREGHHNRDRPVPRDHAGTARFSERGGRSDHFRQPPTPVKPHPQLGEALYKDLTLYKEGRQGPYAHEVRREGAGQYLMGVKGERGRQGGGGEREGGRERERGVYRPPPQQGPTYVVPPQQNSMSRDRSQPAPISGYQPPQPNVVYPGGGYTPLPTNTAGGYESQRVTGPDTVMYRDPSSSGAGYVMSPGLVGAGGSDGYHQPSNPGIPGRQGSAHPTMYNSKGSLMTSPAQRGSYGSGEGAYQAAPQPPPSPNVGYNPSYASYRYAHA